jgi:hypothetical protein
VYSTNHSNDAKASNRYYKDKILIDINKDYDATGACELGHRLAHWQYLIEKIDNYYLESMEIVLLYK